MVYQVEPLAEVGKKDPFKIITRRCSVDGQKRQVWTQIFLETEQNNSVFVWKRISEDGALAIMVLLVYEPFIILYHITI